MNCISQQIARVSEKETMIVYDLPIGRNPWEVHCAQLS